MGISKLSSSGGTRLQPADLRPFAQNAGSCERMGRANRSPVVSGGPRLRTVKLSLGMGREDTGTSEIAHETTSEELVAAFTELGPSWVRWVNANLPHASVSYVRLRLLNALGCRADQTMTELAGALDVTQRRVTALVDALEADGFVERRPHPRDGRSTIVSLTKAGKEERELRWHQQQIEIGRAFADLPAAQQKQLLEISRSLTEIFRRRAAEKLRATGSGACD